MMKRRIKYLTVAFIAVCIAAYAQTYREIPNSLHIGGGVRLEERADHAFTPAAGFGELWVKSTTPSTLVFTDDAGTDTTLGSGDVVGPASATDNAVTRYDGTSGTLLQNSAVTIDDSGNIATAGTVDGVDVSGIVPNATHTGDVTGATALTIAAGAVDIPMLSATGTADATTYLRGDNTWATVSGTGDVVGPASSTDNALVRFDSTTGKLIQDGTITQDDSGNLAGVGTLNTHTIPGGTGTIALTSDITGTNSGTNTGDQTITLTGDVTGTGTGSFAATIAPGAVALTTDVDGTLPIANGGTGATSLAAASIPTYSSTDTLTNKRITKRSGTVASSATPTINTDLIDVYSITALATDITSMTSGMSGSPVEGDTLRIIITGTAARGITWGASFENGAADLPTSTVSTQRIDVGFVWNTATSKWRCMAAGPTS